MITLTTLLCFLLLLAFAFSMTPIKFLKKEENRVISLSEMPTSEIKSIIMFVSDLQPDKDISDLLAYKILSQMSNDNSDKIACLIHSKISDIDKSSYKNTFNLVSSFESENFKINTFFIKDVFDIEESFNVVNNVLKYLANNKNVVCDFTSGTKPMSLGMAMACLGEKRLIYFPRTEKNDAARYLHINTGDVIDIK